MTKGGGVAKMSWVEGGGVKNLCFEDDEIFGRPLPQSQNRWISFGKTSSVENPNPKTLLHPPHSS